MLPCRQFVKSALLVTLVLALTAAFVGASVTAATAQDPKKPVLIEGKKTLFLKIITRPLSNVYAKPEAKSKIVKENVPAFTIYYVYQKPKASDLSTKVAGWYQIGVNTRGNVIGWMRAEDVMEWRQAMVLAFTNPVDRKPVLFFSNYKKLETLVKSANDARRQTVTKLYRTITAGDIPQQFPVVSIEPKNYVDITTRFYLLPVLYAAEVEINDRPATLLKVSSATLTGGRKKSDIRKKDVRKKALSSPDAAPKQLTKMGIDIVFVIDATASMGPFIAATRKVIGDMAQFIRSKNLQGLLRFGLVAFRDNIKMAPGLGFTSKKVCTLEQGSTAEAFFKKTATLKAAGVSSVGFQEDVWAGVLTALKQMRWSPNALRFIILIGDASAHPPGSPFSTTGLNAQELRRLASAKRITIIAMHLLSRQGRPDHPVAKAQFSTLATNPGTEIPAYFPIKNADVNIFQKTARTAADALAAIVQLARQGKTARVTAKPAKPAKPVKKPEKAISKIKRIITRIGYAAQVQWLGRKKGVQAPRDVTAWVVDKDLISPSINSLRVKLLITKAQLSDLQRALKAIMIAGRKAQISGTDFFEQIKGAAAAAGRDPSKIGLGKTLGKSGLMGEYLAGLPYKSRIMSLTKELWASMSTDEQQSFLQEVEAKIKIYKDYHDDPKLWVALHKGDDPKDYVMAIDLIALP